MLIALFLFFAFVNLFAYLMAIGFSPGGSDPSTVLSISVIIVWLAFVVCLALFLVITSERDERLGLPKKASHLLLGFALVPQLGFCLGLTINYQDYLQLALRSEVSTGTKVFRTGKYSALISGEIGKRTVRSLKEEIGKGELQFLELDSLGGGILAAYEAGQIVEDSGIATKVENKCESACVIVALFGRELLVSPEAQFGFHRASSVLGEYSELGRYLSETGTSVLIELLKERGVTDKILKQAERTPSGSMFYVSGTELYRLGLADGFVK